MKEKFLPIADDGRIKELVQKMAEAESEIQTYFAHQVDSLIDPMKGSLILLRQAQEALVEEVRYHQMANILQSVKDGIIVTDLDGIITYWNEGATSIYGQNAEEMLGKSLLDFYAGRGWELSKPDLENILQGKEYHLEWEGKDKEGASFWIESRMTLMRGEQTKTKGFIRVEKDVTERKRNEAKLVQVQKLEALGTLAGGVAHDFNNILGAIITNSELALMDLPEDSGLRDRLDPILAAGLRGRDLVKQILTFSRKSEMQYKRTDLKPLIMETFKFLRSSLPTTIEMDLSLEKTSKMVDADPGQIQQVIMNLATNAAYAIGRNKGKIAITTQMKKLDSQDIIPDPQMGPGEYLVLSVEDSGCGMDEQTRKRIFEPFFTTKAVGEGTGLGLSMVYGIVKAHRGGISVYSEPGKGSVFHVYFPVADGRDQVEEEKGIDGAVPGGKERVLLLDDEESILVSVSAMLKRLGYEVTATKTVDEALTVFSKNPSRFDLVITDQTMPKMTGEEMAGEMIRVRPDIPIILCTGHSGFTSSEKAKTRGVKGYIIKPFRIQEGARIVRRVLDESKQITAD